MELKGLRESLTSVKDPRRISYGNIRHKLDDIVIIGLCTVISNGEDYNDMEAYGHEREEWLRTFLELPNGIPDSDTFRRVFERINPQELSECLYDWLDMARAERGVVYNGPQKSDHGLKRMREHGIMPIEIERSA